MNLINVVASGDHIPFLTPVRPTGDLFEMALEYSCQTTELNPALPAQSCYFIDKFRSARQSRMSYYNALLSDKITSVYLLVILSVCLREGWRGAV